MLLGGGGLRFIIVVIIAIKTVYIIIIITIIMMNNTIVKGALCSCCANEIRSQMEEKRKGQGSEMRQMTSSRSNFDKERRDCITRFFWQSTEKWFSFTTMTSSRNFFSSKKSKKVVDGESDKSTERNGKGLFSLDSHGRIFFRLFLKKNAFRPCVM